MMVTIGDLHFRLPAKAPSDATPLMNSASPWADVEHLHQLHESPSTSAVTTRTVLLIQPDVGDSSFQQDDKVHTHVFLRENGVEKGSLNSYGYAPRPLQMFLAEIRKTLSASANPQKPFIVSITGDPEAVHMGLRELSSQISGTGPLSPWSTLLGCEINLSCPNIRGVTVPPGYSKDGIKLFIHAAKNSRAHARTTVTTGLKIPPYTYPAQFSQLVQALEETSPEALSESATDGARPHTIQFLTAINTLGGCTWFKNEAAGHLLEPSLPVDSTKNFEGFGGLAGESLHPLALGTVKRLRMMLDASQHASVREIKIIGVGGVTNGAAARRMQAAGAAVVALATSLGREGVVSFDRILSEL
ncbi:FMN-linked oxidoreductase [Tilletiaria anomala UBC 951]|uniref:Dihydroorotate oxidase n=1 Tax=Tilletiaria anomala (strain ATCC 24038 / CBS 436.72 / UBC 951) TaxID=1037660 RepID=A0A066VXV6_TILAU|nr:FMN-linked oxidoreductase [Tilletiaria anomala UBC 951]KDN46311.1 FMN-linked oxidoreductase [Tilletiaria anomala UBC 951]